MIKPNLICSHNWHIQPNCQRSVRASAWAAPFWIEARAVTPRCPRTCCAHRKPHLIATAGVFARTF